MKDNTLEMLWKPQTSQGDENNIFTAVNYHHYTWPADLCFDVNCFERYDPVRQDKRLEDYNID